jgi:hypothetical protein
MNYPGMYGGMTPEPKKSRVGLILLVVAAVLALLIVGALSAFHAASGNAGEAIAVSDRFLYEMGEHDYQGASALFTPEAQAKASPLFLYRVESLMETSDGGYVSHGTPQWFVQNVNGQTSVRLTYPVQYAHGSGHAFLTLVNAGDGYRIRGCNLSP